MLDKPTLKINTQKYIEGSDLNKRRILRPSSEFRVKRNDINFNIKPKEQINLDTERIKEQFPNVKKKGLIIDKGLNLSNFSKDNQFSIFLYKKGFSPKNFNNNLGLNTIKLKKHF